MICHLRLLHRSLAAPLLAAAACLLAAPSFAAQQQSTRRILVLPLDNLGVEEDVAASLLGFLHAEIRKLPGVTLVDPAKVARGLGADCRGEVKCLSAAAARLKADELVYGTVAGVGAAYSIDLKQLLVKPARENGRVTEMLSGERELLIDGVRGAAYKLLLPAQYVGQVKVEVPEKGAEVWVDGKLVGKSPLKQPIAGLAPGRHALKIVKEGYADFDKWVEVRFARVSVVKVDLATSTIAGVMYESQPLELAPLTVVDPVVAVVPDQAAAGAQPDGAPAPLTTLRKVALGVGGASLVAWLIGAGFGIKSSDDREAAQGLLYGDNGVFPRDVAKAHSLVESVETNAFRANAFFVTGALTTAGAAALWYFGAPSDVAPAVTPTPGGATVGVSGSF